MPPTSRDVASCHLVALGASGDWAGQEGALACFSEAGWRFVAPVDGLSVVDRASGEWLDYRGGAWEAGIVMAQEVRVDGQAVLRGRQGPVAEPSGGTVVDSQCRAAVSEMLAALRAHGLIS